MGMGENLYVHSDGEYGSICCGAAQGNPNGISGELIRKRISMQAGWGTGKMNNRVVV